MKPLELTRTWNSGSREPNGKCSEEKWVKRRGEKLFQMRWQTKPCHVSLMTSHSRHWQTRTSFSISKVPHLVDHYMRSRGVGTSRASLSISKCRTWLITKCDPGALALQEPLSASQNAAPGWSQNAIQGRWHFKFCSFQQVRRCPILEWHASKRIDKLQKLIWSAPSRWKQLLTYSLLFTWMSKLNMKNNENELYHLVRVSMFRVQATQVASIKREEPYLRLFKIICIHDSRCHAFVDNFLDRPKRRRAGALKSIIKFIKRFILVRNKIGIEGLWLGLDIRFRFIEFVADDYFPFQTPYHIL